MYPGCFPARICCRHSSDTLTNFTIGMRPSRSFGFQFPEMLKSFAVPLYNGFWFNNDKVFSPRTPNPGKQNPEESIYLRPIGNNGDQVFQAARRFS